MVECVTTLEELYSIVLSGKGLEIGDMKIPPGSLRNALRDNLTHLVGLPQSTIVKINTEYNPDQNPICPLGHVVYTGFNGLDPEFIPAWMYIGERNVG